jgi:hypothetical protein
VLVSSINVNVICNWLSRYLVLLVSKVSKCIGIHLRLVGSFTVFVPSRSSTKGKLGKNSRVGEKGSEESND